MNIENIYFNGPKFPNEYMCNVIDRGSDYSITCYCHVVINLCDQVAKIIEMKQIDKHAEQSDSEVQY